MTDTLGSEFHILLREDVSRIAKVAGDAVGQAIDRVRKGKLSIDPGYDGVFGIVKIWDRDKGKFIDPTKKQLTFPISHRDISR